MRARVCRFLIVMSAAATFVAAGAAGAADLDCLVQPSEVVAISSAVQGLVEKVNVDRGDLVKEGMALVVLESSAEKAAVAIARARAEQKAALKSSEVRVDFGQRRFVRTDDLFKQNLVPMKDMDEAETSKILAEVALLEARENQLLAQLDVDRLQAALDLRTIRSPLTGVVMERMLAPGEFAGREPIMRLARIDPLRVEVFAPVSMLGRVRPGMRATVRPEAPVGGSYTARVTVVDRVADPASGTFGVRLELPNADHRLPAGLRCKVQLRDEVSR